MESSSPQNKTVSRLPFGTFAIGHTFNKLWDVAFDYGLYPFVIYWCGLGRGFVIMAILSLIVCWLFMCFYDWSKQDWLGIEALKELKTYDGSSRSVRWFARVLKKSDALACVILSIKFDPFITTIYLRRGRFGGMNHADWRVFLISWFIGNAWWSVVCFSGISAAEMVWRATKFLVH